MEIYLVDILGTKYQYVRGVSPDDEDMEGCFGACFYNRKVIKIIDLFEEKEWKKEPKEAIENKLKEIERHEIIHAFLSESGLRSNSSKTDCWALNEEMINWFAIQTPKIFKVFKELDLLTEIENYLAKEIK